MDGERYQKIGERSGKEVSTEAERDRNRERGIHK
jgi:hypothetical protein